SSVKIVNGGKRPGAGVHGVVASPEFIPQLLLHSSPLPMSGLTIELTTTFIHALMPPRRIMRTSPGTKV
ncbi:MAG: hypothetical protein ABJQ14_08735, partial [Hyphomicrobiales bacterium]